MDTQTPEDRLGMNEAQWARWQAYTHGYGDQDENGIDLSLLRDNLRLTPAQRLAKLQAAAEFQWELRAGRSQSFSANGA